MVKECLIVLNNEAVTVVRYGDIDIQFPSINKDVKKVFVNYEDGKYSIVDEKKVNSVEKPKKKINTSKKTTLEKGIEIDADNITRNDNE